MKWSWKLGEAAGIGVYMHATFLLLIGWVGLSYWLEGQSLLMALTGIGFILVLFACVVLHEFGHALTARKYGIKTRDITLLPIGGVARLERMPDDPHQELWVALAGPAVNVVISGILFGWLLFAGGLAPMTRLNLTSGSFMERLMLVNLFLAGFNLIPAFPMDGGRVARALLAMRMDYTQATHIAASLGQGVALIFGFIGLFSNPFLLFIALFVWIGAAQEASMVQLNTSLHGIPVSRAMLTNFRTLSPKDPLSRAVELLLSESQQEFPVVEDSHVVGVLTRSDLLTALAKQTQSSQVAEAMHREFLVVDSYDMLSSAFHQLQECHCRTLPVTHGGEIVGLLTSDNVGEFLMVQAALGKRKSTATVG